MFKVKKNKGEKGITLIVLIVTIIVLLILAGISIVMLTSENGIVTQAEKAKIFTEIEELNERIELSKFDDINKFGKINDVLNINSNYNDKLEIENGKLVYIDGKFNNKELEWLKELGINSKNRYYMVMSVSKKENEYKNYSNAGTLIDFRNIVNDGSFSNNYDIAYLIEDINFSEINSGNLNEWTPIGTEENKFNKIFDGGKNKIENVNINSDLVEMGIFSYNSGTIKNLILESGTVNAITAGGIACINEGKIINCANKVNIKTDNNSGGIAGRNTGEILASYNEGSVEINGFTIGGVVGFNKGGIVKSCYNIGKITNHKAGETGNTGGIVGSNNGEIENCFNKGEVVASSDAVSGICGINYKDINNCYNLGKITTSTNSIGGIVGYNTNAKNNTNIVECINGCDINGQNWIGGIVGYVANSNLLANIINCKNNCKIEGKQYVGGIIGFVKNINNLEVNNCKWHANDEIKYGIGSEMLNENAVYVEDLELESVLDIINGDNDFKMKGNEVVLNWK